MFEAHFAEPEDFQGLETSAYSWAKTYFRRHKTSFQPLRIWFAWGKRKIRGGGMKRKLFIYIEYQDSQGSNHYRCLEAGASLSVEQALGLAVNANLDNRS